MDEKRCYEVLGITKHATDEEVKAAYRAKAKLWHPDAMRGKNEASRKFREVAEAYDTIQRIRAERAKKYDTFKNVINNAKQKITRTPDDTEKVPERGRDIFGKVELTFTEAALGCSKRIQITRQVNCTCSEQERPSCILCEGLGYVRKGYQIDMNLPSGLFDGQTVCIRGKGNESREQGEPGDLFVDIHVLPSSIFSRRGVDILYYLTLTYPEAVLGTTKIIPTIYGDVECDIPKGIEIGAKIRLNGKGILRESTGEIGNQYVVICMDIPKTVTEREQKCIEKLDMLYKAKERYETGAKPEQDIDMPDTETADGEQTGIDADKSKAVDNSTIKLFQ